MSHLDPSANGHGSSAWLEPWTHLRVRHHEPRYCQVTFDHPPINTITARTMAELAEVVGLIEEDQDLNVVVFDSANPDFYLTHYDGEHNPSKAWLSLLVRLSRAPPVSIASIRGRARGAGSEFVLACDMRFASRESTILGPFEVGTRCRALEMLLVADDRLDHEVDEVASRLARLDHEAIARTKSYFERSLERRVIDTL